MTLRHVHSIAPLASAVLSDRTEYERARAATALGYEMAALKSDSDGSAADLMRIALEKAGAKRLEVALLDLIGFASEQQRLWKLWAQDVSKLCPLETGHADPMPDNLYLTMEDARIVRQNCATVLAMVLTIIASTATSKANLQNLPALQAMKEAPASVMASAKDTRQKLSRSENRKHCNLLQSQATLDTASERRIISPTIRQFEVSTRGDGTSLNLLSSALMPICDSDAQGKRVLVSARQRYDHGRAVSQYISDLEEHSISASATSYLYDHAKGNARAGREGGYLRKVDGGYRAPNLGLTSHRRSILSLSDIKPEKHWRDEQLGYQVDKVFMSRRLELRSNPPTYYQKRGHPVSSHLVLKEHCDINSFASYAGTVALDPVHPHATQMRSIFVKVPKDSKNSMDSTSSKREARESAFDKVLNDSGETAGVLESKESNTSEALKHFTTNKECIATEASLTHARDIASWEEGPLEKQKETRQRTLRGPGALDAATPYLPVSAVDVRRVLAWSPRTGVQKPLSLHTSRRSTQGPVGLDATWNINGTNHPTIRSVAGTLLDHLRGGQIRPAHNFPITDVVSMQEQHSRLVNWCKPATTYENFGTYDLKLLKTRISFSPSIRALQKHATAAMKLAAREAEAAWRDVRLQAMLKAPVHNGCDEPMNRIFSATQVARRAEEKLADYLQVETAEFIKQSVNALPIRLATQFAPHMDGFNSCSADDSRLAYALHIKRRIQRILARWIDEYEKSQLVIALGLWRISVWEYTRKDKSAEYRHKGAAARLRKVVRNHHVVVVARAFKTLVSRTGWLIFLERSSATLKIQTVYRRYITQLLFIAENDAHVFDCTYANINLGESRDPKSVRFYIDLRVRSKRRCFWKSAIVIQRQQRRNASHVDYQHARRGAIIIESACRMRLKRRCFLVLRECAIVIETLIRMFLASQPFARLCSASRVSQRVVRGHMGRRLVYNATYERRHDIERRDSASRILQQLWRGFMARHSVAKMRNQICQDHWAGLRLQFAWYRKKGFFATFVLLSCLRVSDEEDQEYAAHVCLCIRKMAARRISIYYRAHLTRMRHKMAVIIESCWKRHVATNKKLKLQKATWAKRKLRCFVRAKLKQRHSSSRKLAHCWWRARPGRLLRHLEHKMAVIEKAEEAEMRRIRDTAAGTIQAIIHGQLTRRLLRREHAILVIQCKWRISLAQSKLSRKQAAQKGDFVIRVASSSSRDAVNNELLAYTLRILNHLIQAQARVRGYMTRRTLRLARVHAHSIAIAALTLQRTVRQRQRCVAALKHFETTRRRKNSIFKDCRTFDDVFVVLSRCRTLPKNEKKPWLWYDVDDSFCGIGPHAFCRRSGLIEALPLIDGGIVSIRSISAHRRSCGQSSPYKDYPIDESVRQVSEIARQTILCRFTEDNPNIEACRHAESKLEEIKPLIEACDRRTAAILVCSLKYAGISHRQINALHSHKEIENLISYQSLPFACRKLVDAFSWDQIFEVVPKDLSLGMMRNFCARYPDAEKALRALRSKDFTCIPWVPSPREVHYDTARVKRSYQIRRDALEWLQSLLETKDPCHEEPNLLSATIACALRAADAAIDVASARMRRARRRRYRSKKTQMKAYHKHDAGINSQTGAPLILDSSSTSPLGSSISYNSTCDKVNEHSQIAQDCSSASQREFTSAAFIIPKDDRDASSVASYLDHLNFSHPDIYEMVRGNVVFSIVPGIEQDESAVALAVANVVFCRAFRSISDYILAAKRICLAAKHHLSRRNIATMRHMRNVSTASIAYSRERSGEAVKSLWKANMIAHAESVKAEKAAHLLAKQRTEMLEHLSRTLRFGWKCLEIHKTQVEATLRDQNEDELSREALLRVFERNRPREPRPVHRNGVKIIPKYRDDDEAREPNIPRIIVKASEDPNNLRSEVSERERRRAPPLYEVVDYEASLTVQRFFRSRHAKEYLRRLRRRKLSQERDAREQAEWERRQGERHRLVTLRCNVELIASPLFASGGVESVVAGNAVDMVNRASSLEDDEQAEFELALFEPLMKIERGVHVLARYNGTGPKRWHSSTICDATSQDIYDVVFDDGEVCKNVPRTRIKVPRISEASHVEAWHGSDNGYFTGIVVQTSSDGSFSVQYEDGTIENCVRRSQLRIPNIKDLIKIEEGRRQARARRRALQALQFERERRTECEFANSQARFVSLCERFSAARALLVWTGEIQQNREILMPGMQLDQNGSALAEMARCVTEAQELTRPRCVLSLKIEYTRVALRYGWRELHDPTGRAYYAHTSRRTTWARPAYDFAENFAARRIQRSIRLSLRRHERDKLRGSSYLPTLVNNIRHAASKFAWTPSGDDPHRANERLPLELWMARRGFSPSSISSVLKSVRRQVAKLLDRSIQGRQSEADRTLARCTAVAKTKAQTLQRLRHFSNLHAENESVNADLSNCQFMSRSNMKTETEANSKSATKCLTYRPHPLPSMDDRSLEALGLVEAEDKNWLLSTGDNLACFVAYWTSYKDSRTMRKVIEDAKNLYELELGRYFRNQQARCTRMAEVLTKSRYPITYGQIRRFAHEFAGKPAGAQDAIKSKLVDVATTSTHVKELEALAILKRGAQRAKQLVKRMCLNTLATRFELALHTAEEVCPTSIASLDAQSLEHVGTDTRRAEMQGSNDRNEEDKMSSRAARACWMLDDEVLSVVCLVWVGTTLAQAEARRYLARKAHKLIIDSRIRAATTCQTTWRVVLAVRTAKLYKAQQMADWHMLWDSNVKAFYFLHLSTAEVSWEEPPGGEWNYRPQVKDRFTQKLMLAWPQLDLPKPLHLQQPLIGKCMVCKVEDATRRCMSCSAPKFEGRSPSWGDGYFHFCFACFAARHELSVAMRNHEFEVTKDTKAPSLKCCVCSNLATRMCRGLSLQPRGRQLLNHFFGQHEIADDSGQVEPQNDDGQILHSVTVEKLRNILWRAEIPLSLARTEELHIASKRAADMANEAARSASYYEALQEALRTLASECNDYFCANCWSSTHAKGARAKHVWVGFAPGAPVCALCESSVATLSCDACGDKLCKRCSAAVHAIGKNFNHKVDLLCEPLDTSTEGASYCALCGFRKAAETCTRCGECFCDSCLKFEHYDCYSKRRKRREVAIDFDRKHPTKCAVCGRKPDSRCVECDEVFCTWLGKPRCFAKLHAKGRRREHTLVPYTVLADIDVQRQRQEQDELNRLKAIEELQAKSVENFERAREEARLAKERREDLIQVKATDVLDKWLLDEKKARGLKFAPGHWLLELSRAAFPCQVKPAWRRRT